VAARKNAAVPARAFLGSTKGFSARSMSNTSRRMVAVKAVGNEKVAEGYATALAEVATSNNSLEAVHSDMETLETLFTPELESFLANPVHSDDNKKSVLVKMAEQAQFTPYTTNFLKLLVDKRRSSAIAAMVSAFDDKYCELTNTEVAMVASAVKLESEQQFLIAKKLQELTGAKNIKLKPTVDESLIGGFIIRYGENGSQMLDQSIKGKFEALAAEMA